MKKNTALVIAASVVIAGLMSGCGDSGDGNQAKQTGFPGQVTAGGGTSGEVMARNKGGNVTSAPAGTPGIPQGSGGNTGGAQMGGTSGAAEKPPGVRDGEESVRSQAPAGGVGGTPSIPEGAGGNTSGAAMGGTTSGAAGSQTLPPPPSTTAPSIPAQGGGQR